MKERRNISVSGPVIAVLSLSVTVVIFSLLYSLTPLFKGDKDSPPPIEKSSQEQPQEPSSIASPTPDLSPKLVDIPTNDGIILKGKYYPPTPAKNGSPGLLLLHMAYSNKNAWHNFALAAQKSGYAVLSLDLRGHGESGGEIKFEPKMDEDISTAITFFISQPEVDERQVGLVGASVGANLAVRAAATHPQIQSLALLSPGVAYWELTTDEAIADYGKRPVLLVVSQEDEYAASSGETLDNMAVGEHRLQSYSGAAHGTDMLQAYEDLTSMLLNWLGETLSSVSSPSIGPINASTGNNDDLNARVFEKLELTFNVQTIAKNKQLPFDASPPPGIEPGIGISVDAQFTPDNWKTVYTQPAFYYQDFIHEQREQRDWLYPTNNYSWKVRFSPPTEGEWQFKIFARDAGGKVESPPQSFLVMSSDNKGFVRVSETDPRYFEFENGDLFLGLGYNLTFGQLDWINPTIVNKPEFQKLEAYGLQFFRTWLTHWGIFSSAWNPWNTQNSRHSTYIPYAGLSFGEVYPNSDVSMTVNADRNPCMFIGAWKARPAVKQNAKYRVRVRYKTRGLEGPRIAGEPFGFVAKTGEWLWGEGNFCHDPNVGTVVTDYQSQDTEDWQILEGEIVTDNQNFLPGFYLVAENIRSGSAFIDYVWIEEDLGNGKFGPNIVSKPWMAHHQYFEQRSSYAFDKVLEAAHDHNIYLKLVVMEKGEWIFNHIDFDGLPILYNPECIEHEKSQSPDTIKCPGNRWFYGNGRNSTKVRWLQQAWWRYLQARWGYSPNIHSWELLNEGDPWDESHYVLADEFAQYMHQFEPNHHLVTTSFWHSFPGNEFWANSNYKHLDYADIHAYAEASEDTAKDSILLSQTYGALQPEGVNKPFIRGETGFSDEVLHDEAGIWLHNYIWAGLNAGGMYEQYWYSREHIIQAEQENDLRHHYMAYKNFVEEIPLNNGNYVDIQAKVSNNQIRVAGQKDLINGCTHLWVQNKTHTWRNVTSKKTIAPVSGTVEVSGFAPGEMYTIEWWNTYQPTKANQIMRKELESADNSGKITISITGLTDDIAAKIVSPDASCS